MKPRGIFVTGTDTGVGKTVVSAALIRLLRDVGIDAVPMKPIQTGCAKRGGKFVAPDLEFMLAAAGIESHSLSPDGDFVGLNCLPRRSRSKKAGVPAYRYPKRLRHYENLRDEIELMCPYRFELACSPHLAAAKAKKTISLWKIAGCLRELAGRHELVVVEGAGGVLVPLGGKKMMIDLIAMLKLPVVLVARPGLGTINHTLLSLAELRRAGATVLGVVFNEAEKTRRGYIEKDNQKMIEWLSGIPVIGRLGYMPGLNKKGFLPRNAWGGRAATKRILTELTECSE